MLYAALAAAVLPVLAAAQNVTTIQVGPSGGLSFQPNNVNASVGDVIQFVFSAPAHSVTQSTLADPCTPLDGGFNSGFATSAGEVWNLTITDTSKPIWFFCAATAPVLHCKNGMAGAINSPADTLNTFFASAKAATGTPAATAVVLSGSGAVATESITSAAVVGSATSPSGSSGSSGSSTTSGAPSSSSSSAAQRGAGIESLGAAVLALFGFALL